MQPVLGPPLNWMTSYFHTMGPAVRIKHDVIIMRRRSSPGGGTNCILDNYSVWSSSSECGTGGKNCYLWLTCYFAPGRSCEVLRLVSLLVGPLAYLRNHTAVLQQFCCLHSVAVALSCPDGVAICYVLPVLSMFWQQHTETAKTIVWFQQNSAQRLRSQGESEVGYLRLPCFYRVAGGTALRRVNSAGSGGYSTSSRHESFARRTWILRRRCDAGWLAGRIPSS